MSLRARAAEIVNRPWIAYAVLGAGIATSVVAWNVSQREVNAQRVIEFEHLSRIVAQDVEAEVRRYTDVLEGFVAFFNASELVTRGEFKSYVESIRASQRFPGLQAISFAKAVDHGEKSAFEIAVKSDRSIHTRGYPDFAIHPLGTRPYYYPIQYTEPFEENAKSMGFDLATEKQRRLSVERARDTGQPTATGKIQLLQDERKAPAFAWRLPIYRSEMQLETQTQRRAAFFGVVNAVLIVDKLMDGLVDERLSDTLKLLIYDRGTESEEVAARLLYDSDAANGLSDRKSSRSQGQPRTPFVEIVSFNMGGRNWSLVFSAPSNATLGISNDFPMALLYGGLLTSVLLFALTRMLFSRSKEAFALAQEMTGRLSESEERYRVIAETVPVALVIVRRSDYGILSLNAQAAELFRIAENAVTKRVLTDYLHAANGSDKPLVNILGDGHGSGVEVRVQNGLNDPRWALLSAQCTAFQGEDVLLISLNDITQRKFAEEKIRFLAQHDELTGLASRNLLTEHIHYAISEARRERNQFGLMFLDLDRFKNINDTFGHHIGDELLKMVAHNLRRAVRESDTVSRMGGDEFVILFPHVKDGQDLANLAQKIIDAVSVDYMIEKHPIHTSVSIGISVYPADGDNADTLMSNADTAMYHAKSQGRNIYKFFTQELNEIVQERLILETQLRNALDANEFLLHFQPQFDTARGNVCGFEALIRWRRMGKETIPPGKFIPIAEDTGLVIDIGNWVLDRACRYVRHLRDKGYQDLRVAVNLSPQQLRRKELVQIVEKTLAKHEVDASWLEVEITETVLLQHEEETVATLTKLSEMGVQIALDDFGTGYSSLSYLKRFPIDCIKIDQSFVRDIDCDRDDRAIVLAIIAMAKNLDIRVVAEGVETKQQVHFLRESGCHELQGYLLATPMEAEEAMQFLKRSPATPTNRVLAVAK